MEAINWHKYKSDDFQLFCNALLSFEIGKQYLPFTAPGKDGGIDGWFEGTYQSRHGKWRFQDKFHKTARKTAVNALKSDLKSEIAKIKDEQFLVLLTNIELQPHEHIELCDLFKKEKPQDKEVFFELWDGAKVFTLSLRYPLLWLWLDEGFATSQLQDYKIAFAKQLSNPISEAFTFINQFGFREDKLQELRQFLMSDSKVALITGEAGIGKTRLVLEFFRQVDLANGDTLCLVLQRFNIDFEKSTKALAGTKKILLLVDDAHEYDPKTIADLNTMVANPALSVQLLLTAREIQSYNSIHLIKEYEQQKISRIRLEELTREETQALLANELGNHYLANFLNELTNITHGKPILIVSVLRAADSNMRVEFVKNDDFLNRYVNNYFSSLTSQITADTNISPIKSKKLLQLICLLEPFSYKDTKIAKQIATCLNIETDAVTHMLTLLINGSFVSGRYEQSVKPDYYSDIILRNADNALIEEALQQLPESTNNIIANLASADEVGGDKQSMLKGILDSYIDPIKTGTDSHSIARILDTIQTVSYFKPEIVKKTVEIYLDSLHQKDSALYNYYQQHKNYHYETGSDIEKITGLLSELLYWQDYFEFVYRSIFKLHGILSEHKLLVQVFQFGRRDYIEHYAVSRQLFFVNVLQKESAIITSEQLLFGIECLKSFLNLDFTAATGGATRNTITLTTYFIPENTKIKKLRKEIIELLASIFKLSDDEKIKNTALTALLDIPRAISATKRNTTYYKGDDEITLILEFLKEQAQNIPQLAQKEVLDRLYWYSMWQIGEHFNTTLREIRKLLTPRNLIEEMIQLFTKSELQTDLKKSEERVIKAFDAIYERNSAETIAESLSTIFQSYGNELYNFHLAISSLSDKHPSLAKQVYLLLWNQNRAFIYQWGSTILNAIYFKHKDALFYWKEVERLQAEQSPASDNVILWNYGTHHASKMVMSENDFEAIEKIAAKNNPQNYFSLARPLVVFVVQRPEKGKQLCMGFLSRCHYTEADHLFVFLSDNMSESYEQVKYLALNGTIRFGLSYSMEKCLNQVIKRDGADLIYDYLMKRVEYKRQVFQPEKSFASYELVPNGEHSHLFDNIEESVKNEVFKRVIVWYCQEEFDSYEPHYLKGLFKYFNKGDAITGPTNILLSQLTDQFKTDKKALIGLLEVLASYHHKNEQLLELIEKIYLLAVDVNATDSESTKDLHYRTYSAITEVGVKSGTAGKPFQVDLDLKELLRAYSKNVLSATSFSRVLESAMKSVEQDIARSSERENETW